MTAAVIDARVVFAVKRLSDGYLQLAESAQSFRTEARLLGTCYRSIAERLEQFNCSLSGIAASLEEAKQKSLATVAMVDEFLRANGYEYLIEERHG
jgi:hypothetical protein